MANSISALSSSTDRERIGKYRLLRELDVGPRGTVYAAEEANNHRAVIVRLLPGSRAERGEFLDETRRLIRLEHAHIAALVDAGENDGDFFLVTEMLKGEALQDRLKREHQLPLKESLRIAREVSAGLAYAHVHGFIHRDLSPANIWLEPSGRVRLLGLGVSPAHEHQSLLNRFDEVGTPGYLAPEQAAGEAITPAADLFSLGCILYQMVSGERPFRGDNSAALFRAVVFDHPTAVRQINPEVPEAVDDLISQLLAKLPADRPESAQAVEQRLMGWLDPLAPRTVAAKPGEALPLPASRRILEMIEAMKNPPAEAPIVKRTDIVVSREPAKRRRSWLVDVIAFILLVAGALGLYLWWKASHHSPAQPTAATSQIK